MTGPLVSSSTGVEPEVGLSNIWMLIVATVLCKFLITLCFRRVLNQLLLLWVIQMKLKVNRGWPLIGHVPSLLLAATMPSMICVTDGFLNFNLFSESIRSGSLRTTIVSFMWRPGIFIAIYVLDVTVPNSAS